MISVTVNLHLTPINLDYKQARRTGSQCDARRTVFVTLMFDFWRLCLCRYRCLGNWPVLRGTPNLNIVVPWPTRGSGMLSSLFFFFWWDSQGFKGQCVLSSWTGPLRPNVETLAGRHGPTCFVAVQWLSSSVWICWQFFWQTLEHCCRYHGFTIYCCCPARRGSSAGRIIVLESLQNDGTVVAFPVNM